MRTARFIVIISALALFVAACTTPAVETTSTTSVSPSPTTTESATTTTSAADPALGFALPIDPEVKIGVLGNGLTYYLRHNDSPGGRVELRLLVDAGSVQEEADQAGIAHFLEHMMFNGTQRFPRNDLIAALESFGSRFGPDINAFTSFDETVYELSLAAEEDLITLGIDVLREWASRATLTETDVVEERGVVLDEWRLRAQGFNGRVGEAFQELILPETIYEGRLPIGDADSIEATDSDTLRRFYEDWYRPERMAVVAVGDIDIADMEERITDAFGDLEGPDQPKTWDSSSYVSPSDPRVSHLTDEEAAGASVTVVWPHATRTMDTVGDFQSVVALSMAMDILSNRLNDDALRGETPLLGSSALMFGYTRLIGLSGIDADARPSEVEKGLRAMLTEVRRVEEFGLTDEEFDRALTRFRAASEQSQAQQGSTQDIWFAEQISAHHLSGGHLMSPEQEFRIGAGVVERLTKTDVEAAFLARVSESPLILALGPDDADAVIPDSTRIIQIMNEVASAEITARPDSGTDVTSLMARPAPAEVLSQTIDDDFGFATLTFANGSTVYLWPSTIAESGVFALAESFGGTSQIDVEDLPEAFLVTDIIGRSGVGPADVPTMHRLLSDRLVDVFPWVSETREGLTGSAASRDVEVLLQLMHLYMTAPRIDDVAVTAVLDEMATLNASRDDIPEILFDETLDQGYYGDDPRYFVLPSAEDLARFDLAVAERVYRERFANAGDFAFAFVGDFDVGEMTDLVARYIGTLPGSSEHEGFVDNQPLPPREIQVLTVEAGSDPQGRVGLFFTNEFEPVLDDRLTGRLLELIVNARLRNRIREQLSATYSIFSGIDLQRDPDPFLESFILSTGHPDDLPRISDEVMADLADLRSNGPTEAQFATALEQLRTEMDLIDNRTLARALVTSYLYPDQPVVELSLRYDVLETITPEDVRALARIAFNPAQRIEVRLGPRP